MKVIISHPTGNANVRAILAGLNDSGALFDFYTTIATFPGGMLDKTGMLHAVGELKRRGYDESLRGKTKLWPYREALRLIAMKANWQSMVSQESDPFSVDSVYKSLDKRVASQLNAASKKGLNAVYAYEDGALETFKRAKSLNLTCIYDLPIAFWETTRKLIREEAERLPRWASTLGGGITDSQEKLDRKSLEFEMADVVITPGAFVACSLPASASDKHIVKAPFGSPQPKSPPLRLYSHFNRPLRVLFAGSMGQRKGLGDLFEAVKMLNTRDIELVVIGSLQESLSFYKRELPGFTYEPTRSHPEVLKLMSKCDVLCLPSIIEGRALVMQEAMSQGMPIIITPNTGGEDLVIEGKTGFLVPIRSPHLIAEKLHWFLRNRDAIPVMSMEARHHAATYSWQQYANTIVGEIDLALKCNYSHY